MADTSSIADRLREKRQALTEEREPKVFQVPGYGTDLQVKYRILTREERKDGMSKMLTAVRGDKERVAEKAMCRDLGLACLGFYTERDGDLVPLNEDVGMGDDPITWGDERLAELLELEVAKPIQAREIIEEVFGHNDDALEFHHNALARWIETAWEADDPDF